MINIQKIYEEDWTIRQREEYRECYMVRHGTSESEVNSRLLKGGFFHDGDFKYYKFVDLDVLG